MGGSQVHVLEGVDELGGDDVLDRLFFVVGPRRVPHGRMTVVAKFCRLSDVLTPCRSCTHRRRKPSWRMLAIGIL